MTMQRKLTKKLKQIIDVLINKTDTEFKFQIEKLPKRVARKENYAGKYLENKKNIYQKLKPAEVK